MDRENARLLFDYNAWANHLILDQVAEVGHEDYVAPADGLSFGSLHGTLLHLLDVERGWLSRWQGEPEADPLTAENTPDFAALRELWPAEEERQQVYLGNLTDEMVMSPVEFVFRSGRSGSQPLWAMIVHLINHSTQFRSEAAVRLTQLGKSPGNLDLFIYMRETGSGS